MSTTQPRSAAAFAPYAFMLIAATLGLGASASAVAAPLIVDLNTEIRAPATALAPARRMSFDSSIPIFPMQVTPSCSISGRFGDPRSGGRVHQGTDFAASLGREIYAVVDGTLGHRVINGEPDSSLSGNSWRLTAAGKKTWYVYMHLSGFAPGLSNGSVVVQGQLIGYVGDTGNPGPGNYHLHFEVHPDGGAAINPLTVLPTPGCGA